MLKIEFICLLINRSSLDRKYPGGSDSFLEEWGPFNSRSSSYDDHMVKFGAMNSAVISDLIEKLESLGLVGLSEASGAKAWVDFCVVEELMGLRARCDWVSYNSRDRTASYIDSE